MAHELAHVVQQQRGGGPIAGTASLEQAADRTAGEVVAGRPVRVEGRSRRGSIQRQKKQGPAVAAAAKPTSGLPRSMLVELALERLDQPELKGFGGIEILRRQLRSDLQTAASPEEPQLRERAERLNRTLVAVQPVFKPLVELEKKESYLPDLQDRITGHVKQIKGMYAAAIVVAYSSSDPGEKILADAEKLMTELPAYIVKEYLGSRGIESLIRQLPTLLGEIHAMRKESGNPAGRMDWVLNASLAGAPAELEDVRRQYGADPKKATESVQALTAKLQSMVAATTAIALYEQFSYWRKELAHSITNDFLSGKPLKAARKYEELLYAVVRKFEDAWVTADLNDTPYFAGPLNQAGMESLAEIVNKKEFAAAVELIKDRLGTIQTIDVLATVILITAAAALTAGAAGAVVGGLIEATGGGALAIGAGELVAESLVFTAVNRQGQQIAFGKTEGSFAGDFATNLLMFGALKGAGKVFEASFKLAPEAGKAAKAVYGLGKAATSMIVLQTFVEGEHAFKTGKFMSWDERERAIFQNVVVMVALSAGRFITEPIESRIKAQIGGRLRPLFEGRMKALDGERSMLKAQLDSLKRFTDPDPEMVKDVLGRIQTLWEKELKLLADGVRRKALSADDIKPALERYNAQIAELELQLARLNVTIGLGTAEPVFQAVAPGVISYAPGGEAALKAHYAESKGELKESPKFKGVLEGRIAGELTYYVPKAQAFVGAPEAARVAGARDRALRDAAADPEAQLGLDNLSKMFGTLKVDEVLAAAAPADLANLLRAFADPDVVNFKRPEFYKELARRPEAIEFAQRYGARTLRNLALPGQYGWKELGDVLQRASAKIENAKTPADRAAVIEALRTETNLAKLDALIGKERLPKEPGPVRPTKQNMGVDRRVQSWKRFLESEQRYVTDHREPDPGPEVLARRADVLQILDRVKQGAFEHLNHRSRLDVMDRFDELAIEAGMGRGRVNALRGSLAEWLFATETGRAPGKRAFLGGEEKSLQTGGVTILDYSIPHDGFTEWVERKSDWIDRGVANKAGVYASGVRAAGQYFRDANLDLKNLPPGDKISLDFVRDPGAATRTEMLRILFGDATITRCKFGDRWYDRSSLP